MDKWCPVCGSPVDLTSGNEVFSCSKATDAHSLTVNVYGAIVRYVAPPAPIVAPEPPPTPVAPKAPESSEDAPKAAKGK